MAKTNFQIFNEENTPERTYNDSEYKEATQRVGGVIPGMALSRMHTKMYYPWSAMCKAIANLIVNRGRDCMDSDVEGITRNLEEAIQSGGTAGITTHRTAAELDHPDGSVTTPKLRDAAVTGAKIANKAIGKEHLKDGVVDDKAPIASPALTGTPTVPTASKGTSTDQIASTAFVSQAIADADAKVSERALKIAILTGTVAGGETIPLPDGYTEDQCKWIVSVRTKQVDDDDTITCHTDEHRVVTCWTYQRGNKGTVNYMIIGVK